MKRKPCHTAWAAGVTAVCSLYLMTAGIRNVSAVQCSAAGAVQTSGSRIAAAENQWTSDGRHYQVTTQTDPLNMRAEPDTSSLIMTTIPKGAVVTVLQTCDGWGQVQYGSLIGYCTLAWLTLVPDSAPAPIIAPETDAENDPNKNEKRIFQYLTETLGLSPAAACGIIGNIHAETGGSFDPTANNLDAPEGPYGYGLCQWNSGEAAGYRMEELQSYTAGWKTLEGQLDFIRHDLLDNSYLISLHLYEDLKALGNTEEDAVSAADIWAVRYEGCAEWTFEIRREKARLYYGEHCGKAVQWIDDGQTYYVATESGYLNMRATPSVLGEILLTLPKGAAVTVKSISDDGRWAKTEYQGTSGYCAMEYLKKTAPVPTAAGDRITGDLNGDGKIGVEDAQLALTAYVQQITGQNVNLTDAQIKAADIDGDGKIGVSDAQHILMYYTVNVVSGRNLTWEQLL